MNIEAIAFGGKRTGSGESEIVKVVDSIEGLEIFVEAYSKLKSKQVFRIFFNGSCGYRLLEEGDLRYYDNCKELTQSYCVYKILKGGWSNGEICEDSLFNTSKALVAAEWFIATTGRSMNVIAEVRPIIDNI